MNDYDIKIYTSSKDLPTQLLDGNFFHSRELFQMVEESPGDTPYMTVATSGDKVVGQLLVIVHRRGSLIPPYLFTHAHAHGEGVYAIEGKRNFAKAAEAGFEKTDAGFEKAEAGFEKADGEIARLFPLMLKAITLRLKERLCLYIEFSEMSKKMFGYRDFRHLGYIPISWQEIHNSLHSLAPELRLSDKQAAIVRSMMAKGVQSHEATTAEDIELFHSLLRRFYRFKLRRFIPSVQFFEQLAQSKHAKILVTTYKGKIVGGCACVYSQGNAYLWYAVGKRKTYASLHPDTMTIWHALKEAHEMGCRHFHFMDAGLPWKGNPYREFILSFGGKPVTKLRWFRFYSKRINSALRWVFRI